MTETTEAAVDSGVYVMIGPKAAVERAFERYGQAWQQLSQSLCLEMLVRSTGVLVQTARVADAGKRKLSAVQHIVNKTLEAYVPELANIEKRTYLVTRTHRLGPPCDTAKEALLTIQRHKTGDFSPCRYHFNIDGDTDKNGTRYQIYRTTPVLSTNQYDLAVAAYEEHQKLDAATCEYKIEIHVPAHEDRDE